MFFKVFLYKNQIIKEIYIKRIIIAFHNGYTNYGYYNINILYQIYKYDFNVLLKKKIYILGEHSIVNSRRLEPCYLKYEKLSLRLHYT